MMEDERDGLNLRQKQMDTYRLKESEECDRKRQA